jgi:Secretion system C-terminal sorting domain
MLRNFTLLFLFFFTSIVSSFALTITTNGSGGGNWNDPQTWAKDPITQILMVPSVGDNVVIGVGDIVTVSSTTGGTSPAYCSNLTINGTLDYISNNLLVGNTYSSGGNHSVIVNGTLNLHGSYSNSFIINGYLKLNAGSTFNMDSGALTIDGNDGTATGSVPSGTTIFDISDISPSNFNVSNGTIYIMNPHFTTGEPCIKGAQSFTSNGTVSFGNNNPPRSAGNFVISSTQKPVFQNLEVYINSVTNKAILENITVKGALGINKGEFFNAGGASRVFVGGDMNIGLGGFINGDVEFNGALQQNINPLFEGVNTISSAIFNGNLTVNTPKRVKIKLNLELPAGKKLTFIKGKFDTNNKTLTLTDLPVNPTSVNFISTFDLNSEIGTLKIKNMSMGVPILFPIGYEMGESFASYIPVTITPNAMSDFSVSGHPLVLSTTGFAKVAPQWDIDRSNTAGANISFQWNTVDEVGGFVRGDCKAYHHNGTSWDAITPTTGSTSAGTVHTKIASSVTAFSPFTILSPPNLPVELIEFKARGFGNKALLSWSTASEYNNAGFEIEKSLTGSEFVKIGFVKGSGNSNVILNYNFTDKDFAQTAFYRLKQQDIDGKVDYSRIVQVEKTKIAAFKVYPNPVGKSNVNIEVVSENNEKLDVTLMDLSGKVIFQNKFEGASSLISVPTQDLARGIYFLKIQSGTNVNTQKIVKE